MSIPEGFVAVNDFILNTSNTRKMQVTIEMITDIRDKFELCKLTREDQGMVDIEAEITSIRQHPKYKPLISAKAAAELRHIGKFACSLHGDPHNLIQAIRYIDHGTHKEVSSGNNRLLAHILMNAPYIKAEPIEYASESERVEFELAENLQRADLPQADLLLALKHLQNTRGKDLTATEVQSLTQRSRGNAAAIIKILRYPDPVLFEQIAEGYFKSIHAAHKAALMDPEQLKADPTPTTPVEPEQPTLFKVLGSGRDMKDTLALINEFMATYVRNKTAHLPEDSPEYKAALKSAIAVVAPHREHWLRIFTSLKDDEGRYNYDKREIQKLLNNVIALLRSLYSDLQVDAQYAIAGRNSKLDG